MKKVIFGIFAHPDDESFGPCGTFLTETKAGNDLHLITFTLGEAGMNPDRVKNLAAVRDREWRAAGQMMGATSMHYLGFADSKLNNTDMINASQMILPIIKETLDRYDEPIEISIVTSDLNGISGHIDHIVASRTASWIFHHLKKNDNRTKEILYSVVPIERFPNVDISWLYMEPGRKKGEINRIIDARQHRDRIIEIMRCHHTQRQDGETHIATRGDSLGLEYFIARN